MRGQHVCRMHGGKQPAAIVNAARRLMTQELEADASAILAHKGVTGIEDPVELLSLLAAEIVAAKDAIAARVNSLDSLTVIDAPEKLRAEVRVWMEFVDKATRSAEVLARLDLEGRRTSAAERWAAEIQALVQALLSGLELSPVQWERVPTVMSQVLGSRPLELEEEGS